LTPLRFALAGLLLTIPPCHSHHGDCAPGHTWVGDRCLVTDCEEARVDAFCLMEDGTTGNCFGDTCLKVDLASNQNCGQYGLVCPNGEACQSFYSYYDYCANAAGANYSCDATVVCPDGYECSSGACVLKTCSGDATEGKACGVASFFGYLATGVCCGSTCFTSYGFPSAETAPTDNHHCGGCGIDCGDGVCTFTYQNGNSGYSCVPKSCEGLDDGAQCVASDGTTGSCCDSKCSSLQDAKNCGGCGFACADSLACSYGICTNESNGNVTGCDPKTNPCPDGWSCLYGYYCVPSNCSDQPDNRLCSSDGNFDTCCDGTCISVYGGDNKNCGKCGNACADGFTCVYGSCYAKVDCTENADGTYCVGNDNVYSTCCEGKCQAGGTCGRACKPPDVLQGYSCVNPDAGTSDYCVTDQDCPTGYGCVFGYCYQQTCPANFDNGTCAFAGASGSTYGICCGGQCTDYYGDSNNCGGCGQVCVGQTTCQSGGCYGPNFQFVACAPLGGVCPTGSACSGYSDACKPTSCKGIDDGLACAYGIKAGFGLDGLCCDGVCVSTTTDSSNCGSCATKCGPDATCANYGYCTSTTCNPGCKDNEVCANGACVGSVCDPGLLLTSFYGVPACLADDGNVGACCPNGACEETQSDPQNCGGCGIQCPEGQTCSSGTCSGVSDECGPSRVNSYCDLAHSTSSICCPGIGCTDVGSDSANCGSCGVVCPDGQLCTAGTCAAPAKNASRQL
jgi:hypothetical protein